MLIYLAQMYKKFPTNKLFYKNISKLLEVWNLFLYLCLRSQPKIRGEIAKAG